jgi:hypothetical protein
VWLGAERAPQTRGSASEHRPSAMLDRINSTKVCEKSELAPCVTLALKLSLWNFQCAFAPGR